MRGRYLRSFNLTPLIDRLCRGQRDGAWSYRDEAMRAAEPTALAAVAIHAIGGFESQVHAAIEWLLNQQSPDGSIRVAEDLPKQKWTTSLALLAICRCGDPANVRIATARDRAADWLLRDCGESATVRTSDEQHDASLVGWSWVSGTHSWVEPTSYAVIGLTAAGKRSAARAREGVNLIRDRAIRSGGWNYGNTVVLGNTLRPFPETTGVALTALAGEPREDRIDRAIEFLLTELPRIRSPLSLGWGLIGLTAWRRRPEAASEWLREAYERSVSRPANAHHDALLLLAAMGVSPLAPPATRASP